MTYALAIYALLGSHDWRARQAGSLALERAYPASVIVAGLGTNHRDPEVQARCWRVWRRFREDITYAAFWCLIHDDGPVPAWVKDLNYDRCEDLADFLQSRGLEVRLLTYGPWMVRYADGEGGLVMARDRRKRP